MIQKSLTLVEEAKQKGYSIHKCNSVEEAEKLLYYVNGLIGYSHSQETNYGALIIRDTEVNLFRIYPELSEEEKKRILDWRKRERWKKQASKTPYNRKHQYKSRKWTSAKATPSPEKK